MRVCFVTPEVFAFGYYGGLGMVTRTVGRELAKRGIGVYVLTPQKKEQRRIEQLDGMIVLGFPGDLNLRSLFKILFSGNLFRLPEADIYHIEDPYYSFPYLITRATPQSKHIVCFQDPWREAELRKLASVEAEWKGIKKYYFTHLRPYFSQRTILKADALFCPAKYLIPKVKEMHNLHTEVGFLPNPVEVPAHDSKKPTKPTVCFIARWAPVKRVDRFFELAKSFPQVEFIAVGMAYDEARDRELRRMGSDIPNLKMPGLLVGAEKNEILEKSWVMVNTSFHESLPTTYLEACAYKCAILSAENPDDFALNFGFRVQNDDFESGLAYLLEGNRWWEKGEAGFEYVREVHELNKVVDQHIKVYENLMGKGDR